MKIKVCQIIPTLVQGGAEKQLTLLCEGLDRQQFECHVVVLTHSGPYEQRLKDAGIEVHVIGKRLKADPLAYLRLVRLLKRLKPDIVHTWLFAANSYGRLAAKQAGVPVVVTGERSADPWKSRAQLMVDRRLAAFSTCYATNTNAVVDFYADKGLPKESFRVIPNAVLPPAGKRLSRDDVYRKLNIPRRGRLVGAVGRLWPQKGYRDLVWAGELLRVAYEDVWVVILGDGPELQQLQQYRDKSGAEDAVKCAGHRQDASELMSGFDLLWNGSLYEGQSNTILEAMSRGIPVLASDIPGNRDLVVPGETGVLYGLGNVETLTRQTNALLRDDAARQAMGEAAKRRCETVFSLKAMVTGYENLYKELYS
jgi:glycosyltransferase involved in cell wall biosynthesis